MSIVYQLRALLGEEFAPLFYVLTVLQAAFTFWMVVDLGRRRMEYYWFWLILGFQPLGAWGYFFCYKFPELRNVRGGRSWSLFSQRMSLDELRYKAEQLPTLTNRLALGERLLEQQQYAEALPYLEAAWKAEPDLGHALYSLALCLGRLKRPDEAEPLLKRLLARDPRWSNYLAWNLLIAVRRQRDDHAGALASCRELVRLSPILQNQCRLADLLLDQGQTDEARDLLERSLRDHEFTPAPIRRRNQRWASEARRLQKMAEQV